MEQQLTARELVAGLFARARAAQEIYESWTQEQVDTLVKAVAWAAVKEENAVRISRMAIDESKLGNYESKYIKLQKKIRGGLRDIKDAKSVGVIETDTAKGLIKIAKPMGVIGAIIPCTNPEATPVLKAMFALKGRNAVVFSPHPRTKKTNALIVDLMREALVRHGAPADLLIAVENPTLEISNEVMKQCDYVVATGGNPMVKAAYSSGTPAYGVGMGNAVVIVDDTADISDAAKKIMTSKTFDFATSCSADNSVVVMASVKDQLLQELQAVGAYVVSTEEKEKLQATLWVDGHLNPAIIAQSASVIAELAGITLPEGRSFLVVPEDGVGAEHPFSGEKLSVVMALYTVDTFDEAVQQVTNITNYMGKGHSCGIHSTNDANILKLALSVKVSRIMVRQATSAGNSGNWDNGMPFTLTLGCGTWGGNAASENLTWKHLINTTWVSQPIAPNIPTDEDLFGEVLGE